MNNFEHIVSKEISLLSNKNNVLLFSEFDFNSNDLEVIDLLVENLSKTERNLLDQGFVKLKNAIWIKYFNEINNWVKLKLFPKIYNLKNLNFKNILDLSYQINENSNLRFISKDLAIIHLLIMSLCITKEFQCNHINFINKNLKLIDIDSIKYQNCKLNIDLYKSIKYFYDYKNKKISKKKYFNICLKKDFFLILKNKVSLILNEIKIYYKNLINKKVIIFIGPDGSGKSTLIKEFYKLKICSIKYMGPSQYKYEKNSILSLIIIYFNNLRITTNKKKLKGKFYRFSYFFFLYLDSLFRYISYTSFNDADIILIDRFVIDNYVRNPNLIRKILFVNLFPYPKEIFLMRGQSISINKRKKDLSKEKIDLQYNLYDSSLKEKYTKVRNINTTDKNISQSIYEILKTF